MHTATKKWKTSRKAGLWIALGLLLALCGPQYGIRANHEGVPDAGTVETLNVSNGWSSKDLITLVQSGKLPDIYATDLVYYDVESGSSLSLEFPNIDPAATVSSVKFHVVSFIEPLEIEPIDPTEPVEPCDPIEPEPPCPCNPLIQICEPVEVVNPSVMFLQAGGGSLAAPSVAMEKSADVPLVGNTTVSWDLTAWVNSAARVNDLKVVIHNMDPIGEGTIAVDRAYLEVTYGPTPAPVAMNWKVSLLPTDGYDSKNLKTLTEAGMLGLITGNEPFDPTEIIDAQVIDIIGGQSLSVDFSDIPLDATVSSVKVRMAFIHGEGLELPEPIDPTEPVEPCDPIEPEPPCPCDPLNQICEPADPEFSGSAFLQVGRGDLISPSPLLEKTVEVPGGVSTLTWDVTAVARFAADVNDLKLVITNMDFLGAALGLNQAYLEVTYGPTSPPVVIDHPITVWPSDAYASKDATTLAINGKLDYIKTLDGKGVDVESGDFLTIDFVNIPTTQTVKSVKIHLTAYPEVGSSLSTALYQVGIGAINNPRPVWDFRPGSFQTAVTWDVTAYVRTPGRVNDLKLIVRNLDPLGKKITVDQAKLSVSFGPQQPKSTTGFPVTLFVNDGWDPKDLKSLALAGTLDTLVASDNKWDAIESGYYATYAFQNIPSSSVITSAKVYVEHHEELLFTAGGLRWQVAGGSMTTPSVLGSRTPTVLSGELAEATVAWDVFTWINTATRVNDLLLLVRNQDVGGKKAFVDRAYAVVTHKEP